MRHLLYIVILGACLAGCGQKGGLYIPQDEPAPTAAADAATP
jgi:predicted small lipoprotein YifL